MLSRKKLLPLRKEFRRIKKTGKLYDSLSFGFLLSYHEGEIPESAQVAFVVSKKIDKRSVVRHEVKRKLADAVREFLGQLPKSAQIVFLAKQKAINSSPEDLRAEIALVLDRAKLIKK